MLVLIYKNNLDHLLIYIVYLYLYLPDIDVKQKKEHHLLPHSGKPHWLPFSISEAHIGFLLCFNYCF